MCIEFRLDSTVGGKLTNHIYHFRARLDLAAKLASTGIDYFMHFRHFCFVVSIQPRLKHHSTSFQMQKPPLATYLIAFYGSIQTFTLITQRSLFLGLSDNKLISRSKEITSHWSAIKGVKMKYFIRVSIRFHVQRCKMMESSAGRKGNEVNISENE